MSRPLGVTPVAIDSLSPIQRAYLVGDQDGLELRGPARYYLGCDLSPAAGHGVQDRLSRLVRENDILRTRLDADLFLSTVPEHTPVGVDVREVHEADFEVVNDDVRTRLCADDFDFDGWPQLQAVVVRSALRARLHLSYALWMMDAGSLGVFLTELASGENDDQYRPAGNPPSGRAVRSRRSRDERFWQDRATALPEPAQLPLRPNWRYAGRTVTHRMVTLEAPVGERISGIAKARGLTPAMVYLAAYGVVLGRFGGGGAHTVTVLHSQRAQRPTHDTLGNHGNTMPLAIPGTTGESFTRIAGAVQSSYLSQAMYASLSGAEIARLGDPSGSLDRLPYPFAFTALEVDGVAEASIGLRRRWEEAQLRVPQVLLDHQVIMDSDGRVRLGFDWRTDAFDAGFVEDLVAAHAEFVSGLAETEDYWTRPSPRTTPPAATKPARYANDQTLPERVLRIAAEIPQAPAVHDLAGTLTYADLVENAQLVADLLENAGARPGDHVAVHLPRGRGQVTAILGSLLAGCVYIPLDHGTPDGRLDSIARRGAVRFAITDGRLAEERWRQRGAAALTLPAAVPPDGRPHRAPARTPSATAYVIFTSGSTGEPKGVVVSHAAVLATIDAVNDELDLKRTDCILSVSSIGFDLSVYDIFGPLLRGGSVVMLSEETARNPAAWVSLVDRYRVTIWNSAPALAALLAEEAAAITRVRAFMLSGDWIPLALPGQLKQLSPAADVISLGGATEGSIWSIYHRVTDADSASRSIPYGRPLAGQGILVLDGERNICPDWHIGEINIVGSGVADGYLNDPAKTEAGFVDDPVFGWSYRTGDRGRRHPGGIVEFLGRTDSQVKLNGHRVELGEIEHILESLPAVRRCAACVRGEGRRKRVVAYVSLVQQASTGWRQDAASALANALPKYMIPDIVVELDEIPLSSNGKLDRRLLERLPLEDTPSIEAQNLHRQDLRSFEIALCWQEVLGEPPGQENFFDAGGGSFDAIRLLSLLRSRLAYDVSLGDFMAAATLSGLTALCLQARPPQTSGIWSFQPRSGATPRIRVVLFPPVGGGVSCYSALSRALANDVAVHVVGLDRPVVDFTDGRATLADLARHCLQALPPEVLSDVVPRVFAGWSFGGALAFEAARICGVPVERVVVIDTPVSAASRGADGDPIDPTLEGFVADIQETSEVAVDPAAVSADPFVRARFDVYRQNLTLLRDWVPGPCDTPVVQLDATDDPAEREIGAWTRVASVADVVLLKGGHYNVFESDNLCRVKEAVEWVQE